VTLVLAAVAAAALLLWFLALESRGRRDVAVVLVVGVTVLDALLFAHQDTVPIGPFRPAVAGQDLRLVDVLVPVALLARLLTRGLPRRVTAEGLLWGLFFGWYAYAGLVGIARAQPVDLLLFQGKLVIEAGGVLALVAGVPLHRLADPALLRRTAHVLGAVALVLVPMAGAGLSVDAPLLPGARLGEIAPDAATMLFTIGVLVLVGLASGPLPWTVVVGAGAMLAAPLVADQRAALVGTVLPIIVVGAAMGGRVWRRRSPHRVAALVPIIALLLAPVGIAAARSASTGEGVTAAPLVDRLSDTFGSEQKRESAEIRVGLLHEGRRLASDRPVLGQGLGQPVAILQGGGTEDATLIGDFHNVLVDLGVRTGVPGILLFVAAAAVSLLAAARAWTRLPLDAAACLTLAAGAALAGLLTKGMFETIFQKYRLALLLGLLLGIIAAARTGEPTDRPATTADRREPAWT
jgi:hypothetical protein